MGNLSFVFFAGGTSANSTALTDSWIIPAVFRSGDACELDDAIAILVLSVVFIAWSTRGTLWSKEEDGYELYFVAPQREEGLDKIRDTPKKVTTRNVDERMTELGKDVIVFWGSQSGKSERLAKAFVRECQSRFGIAAMAADLDLFDFDQLATLTRGRVAGFIVATYGEGDPTDNASGLYDYLLGLKENTAKPLTDLQYFCFGLGSSRYQSYNRFVEVVDEILSHAGAQRLVPVGKADEARPSDDSWTSWKETILKDLACRYGKEERKGFSGTADVAVDLVKRVGDVFSQSAVSHVAERPSIGTKSHQQPRAVQVRASRQLSTASSGDQTRTYLHVELDANPKSGPLRYQTGDHVAIWPVNPDDEVDLMAKLFGWDHGTMKMAVDIKPRRLDDDLEAAIPVATPTTRDALLRYQLDICGPLTPETARILAAYSPTPEAQASIESYLQDPQAWQLLIQQHLTCAQLMNLAAPASKWPDDLFSTLLCTMLKLRPRYFSIASSSIVDPDRIALAAGIVETPVPTANRTFYGLTTGYLHALHEQNRRSSGVDVEPEDHASGQRPRYDMLGPRSVLAGGKLMAHVRASPFKVPAESTRPIVMVAAGSGIAPFRAFVQERVYLMRRHQEVGRMILFYGCRSEDELLYGDTWDEAIKEGLLEVHLAFSRKSKVGKKTYVQDLLRESESTGSMMLDHAGTIYICGSANMAQGVKDALTKVVGDRVSISELKMQRRLQEDVWVS